MIKAMTKLLRTASSGRIDALSRQVADLSLESVCQLVSGHVESMTFSEARGYVRARAGRVVRKQAQSTIRHQPHAKQAWVEAVTRAATEQIVPLVLRQTGVGLPESVSKLPLAA